MMNKPGKRYIDVRQKIKSSGFSAQDYSNNEEVQNKKTKVISEKELPLKSKNFEKEISKILKKIEKKERYILELSNQLEKINKDNDFNYLKSKKVLSEIKIEQNELIDLEKVWYDLEEQSLKDKVIK